VDGNFKPSGTNPTVYFGSVLLTSLQSATDTLIEASVPPTPPGTYLLSMTNSKKVTGTAYVTIGAVGPPGVGGDQPFEATVHCGDGGKVIDALNQAGYRTARTFINIDGFCDEQVDLFQNNVTFRPLVKGSDAGIGKLFLFGPHGILIEDLKLGGLEATNNAAFEATNLRMDRPTWGNIRVGASSSGALFNPTLTNCSANLTNLNNCIAVGVVAIS